MTSGLPSLEERQVNGLLAGLLPTALQLEHRDAILDKSLAC